MLTDLGLVFLAGALLSVVIYAGISISQVRVLMLFFAIVIALLIILYLLPNFTNKL